MSLFHFSSDVRSLYLHYPLCEHLCSYCDFNVFQRKKTQSEWADFERRWVEQLAAHFRSLVSGAPPTLESIYLGGGTPSLLSFSGLKLVKAFLNQHFDLSQLKEFSFECNPENVDHDYLEALKDLGVNRVSLGVQTFSGPSLKRLERLATKKKLDSSLILIQDSFSNFSFDLMFGIPDQDRDSLREDLNRVMEIQPPHVSIYLLTLPDDHRWYRSEFMKPKMADESGVTKMYQEICASLNSIQMQHYEVSNFARLGFESRHNSNYWDPKKSYFGFGPGAHAYDAQQGIRIEMFRALKDWFHDSRGISEIEVLTDEQKRIEGVYLALRSRKFLLADQFSSSKIEALNKLQLLEWNSDAFRIREESWMLIDSVCQKLIA